MREDVVMSEAMEESPNPKFSPQRECTWTRERILEMAKKDVQLKAIREELVAEREARTDERAKLRAKIATLERQLSDSVDKTAMMERQLQNSEGKLLILTKQLEDDAKETAIAKGHLDNTQRELEREKHARALERDSAQAEERRATQAHVAEKEHLDTKVANLEEVRQ